MEVTLKEYQHVISCGEIQGFNPCFNGSDSKSQSEAQEQRAHWVSILVLMEVTLKGFFFRLTTTYIRSFNPCFNGSDSKRLG